MHCGIVLWEKIYNLFFPQKDFNLPFKGGMKACYLHDKCLIAYMCH